MIFDALPAVLIRWIHIIAATLIIGGAFFLRVVVPYGLKNLDGEARELAFLRMRRIFKMTVHSGILLLILSGSYNAWVNWGVYHRSIPLSHALFGTHILLALIAFSIALAMLSGARPPASHKKWMAANLVILALVVAAASSLKWVREQALKKAAAPTVVQTH